MTQSIEKNFLIDSLTTKNAIYRDLSTLKHHSERKKKQKKKEKTLQKPKTDTQFVCYNFHILSIKLPEYLWYVSLSVSLYKVPPLIIFDSS